MRLRGLLLLALLPLAGCGFGAGDETGDVTLTVTRDYGTAVLHEGADEPQKEAVKEGDTVMRVLQRGYDVKTRYGGGFVQEIDGLAGIRLPLIGGAFARKRGHGKRRSACDDSGKKKAAAKS